MIPLDNSITMLIPLTICNCINGWYKTIFFVIYIIFSMRHFLVWYLPFEWINTEVFVYVEIFWIQIFFPFPFIVGEFFIGSAINTIRRFVPISRDRGNRCAFVKNNSSLEVITFVHRKITSTVHDLADNKRNGHLRTSLIQSQILLLNLDKFTRVIRVVHDSIVDNTMVYNDNKNIHSAM